MATLGEHFRTMIVLTILLVMYTLGPQDVWAQGLALDFSPPLNVANSPGLAQAADIALDPSGGINIAWEDRSVELAMFSRSVDGGKTFSEPVALTPSIDYFSYGQLRVASSHPGEVRAAFTVFDTYYGGAEIAYTGSDDGGATFSQPVFISEFDSYNSYNPAIATGWATAIAWSDADLEAGGQEIKYTQSVDGGVTFTAPRRLNESQGGAICADVVLGGEGTVYAAWMQNDTRYGDEAGWEVFFTRSTDYGATFSTPVNISNYPQKSWCPRMAVDGAGTIYVVWAEGTYRTDIKFLFSRSFDGGNSFDQPRVLAGPLISLEPSLSISASGDGNLWISWMDGDPTVHLDGFVTRSTDGGATFAPAVIMPGAATAIASAGPNIVHAVWNGVFYSRGVGSPQVAAHAPTFLTVPETDADGFYTVSWGTSATSGVVYVLEEATDRDFSIPHTVYSGTGLSTTIDGRSNGVTYYYRVKATLSGYADSVWANSGNGCVVTFPDVMPVQVDGTTYFPSLLAAFTYAVAGENIKAQEMEFFDGPLSLNTAGVVTLQGGYDPLFTTVSGVTTLNGSLSLIRGALVVEGLAID